jgi:nicotinate-nucleotide adenylyltransferase
MGGTFDPIHRGHLIAAELIRSSLELETVVFVPSHCPPHKALDEITPAELRYQMVLLAISATPGFSCSRIEMERGCPTYAGDTIEAFRTLYGDDQEIYFITGLDALPTIVDRERSRTYPGQCRVVAAARPGYDEAAIAVRVPDEFRPYVMIVEGPTLDVSSTEIRKRVRDGLPIGHMVPEAVRDYIYANGLYLQ